MSETVDRDVRLFIYRRFVEGTSLTKRVSVPAEALVKRQPDVEYGNILVPVFGTVASGRHDAGPRLVRSRQDV